MKDKKGMFIVIEGSDGSGKGTQFKLLYRWLKKQGFKIAKFDFPQHGQPSAAAVEEYLNGRYGSPEQVGPYAGSLFFAIDRFSAKADINKALKAGKIVLCNRFTASNMAHQGNKISSSKERLEYFSWLHDLEFIKCGLPKPAKNFVLSVPAETAQKLVDKKTTRNYTDKKRDIHEADLGHLKRSVEVYDELCKLFPKEFIKIDCAPNGKLMSVEQIHRILVEHVNRIIKERRIHG